MLWDLYVCMHLHVCVTERENIISGVQLCAQGAGWNDKLKLPPAWTPPTENSTWL